MSSFPMCSICLGTFEELANISAIACGHTFHNHCIVGWAKNCQTQRDPLLCPTCKTRFETNAARGIVKKLYFTFDAASRDTSLDEKKLKQQIEISEVLLCEAESRDAENAALRRKLELTETLLKSCRNAKSAEMVDLEDKLKLTEAMLLSAREENLKMKRKADLLQEIVDLVTASGLTTEASANFPLPPSSGISMEEPMRQQQSWTEVEDKKKKKKKKKGREGEDRESSVDTAIFLPLGSQEAEVYTSVAENNFLMPTPRVDTVNQFDSLNGTGDEIAPRAEWNRHKRKPPKHTTSESNGDANNNTEINKGEWVDIAGGSEDIYYSDDEEDNAIVNGVEVRANPEIDVEAGDTAMGEEGAEERPSSEANQKLIAMPFAVHPKKDYSFTRQALLEGVPSHFKLNDLKNLFTGLLDYKMEVIERKAGPDAKTRAVLAFYSYNACQQALQLEQVLTKSDEVIHLRNYNILTATIKQAATSGDAITNPPPEENPGANNAHPPSHEKLPESNGSSSPIDCTPIVVTRPAVPSHAGAYGGYGRFPTRPQLQPFQRAPFRMQQPGGHYPYGYTPYGQYGVRGPRVRGPWF